MTISNLMKMAEGSQTGKKTLLEKEKLLVTSNFSFSNSVFKKLSLQARKKWLVWERVNSVPKDGNDAFSERSLGNY